MSVRRTYRIGRRLMVAALRAPREPALVYLAPAVGVPILGLLFSLGDRFGSPFAVSERFLPPALTILGFVLPALVAVLLLAREKHEGTLDRLLTTSVRPYEIAGGYALFLGAVSVLPALPLGLFVARLAPRTGPVGVVQVILALTLLSHCAFGLGFLVSAALPSPALAVRALPLVLLPGLLFSGTLLPVTSLPPWLRPLSWLAPVHHALEACRAIVTPWAGAMPAWPRLVALAGMSPVLWVASALALQRGRT